MVFSMTFAAPEGDQWYGAFFTVRSSNMTDMPGQGKVKRSSAVLPVYIDKKSHIELGVSGKGFKLGPINSPQVLKKLKAFNKSDLQEAFAIQYKKDKRYLTRKELFDKKYRPMRFTKLNITCYNS